MRWLAIGLLLACAVIGPVSAASEFAGKDPAARPPIDRVMHVVRPSQTDPAITQFDVPHAVMFNKRAGENAPLVLFLTGTGGQPLGAPAILSVVANQGYRVIGLAYNDEPAVVQVCPQSPDPDCSARFREERIFGDDPGAPVQNPPDEAIIPRLVSLLRYLDHQYPSEHWGQYLANGEPVWSRLIVSGQSQGAGMAAYIAKKRMVARVVLFSSPWDFYGRDRTLAPWIGMPSLTPMDRWYAEYHRREKTADLLAKSYKLLGLAEDHVRIFDGEPPASVKSPNPYHATTANLAVYIPDWQAMYGTP